MFDKDTETRKQIPNKLNCIYLYVQYLILVNIHKYSSVYIVMKFNRSMCAILLWRLFGVPGGCISLGFICISFTSDTQHLASSDTGRVEEVVRRKSRKMSGIHCSYVRHVVWRLVLQFQLSQFYVKTWQLMLYIGVWGSNSA